VDLHTRDEVGGGGLVQGVSRRAFLVRGAALAAGALALTVPEILYHPPWTARAAAQSLPTTLAAFTALVEAVDGEADEAAAAWIIDRFDKALAPLPERVAVTAAVAAVLDAQTLATGNGATFASADPDQRREVLGAMIKGDDPDMRQIANQVIPFAAFAYWTDATLGEAAQPAGARLPRWDAIGYRGPSHGYAETYTDGGPPGFAAMTDFEP
jgi:hypothetical protein